MLVTTINLCHFIPLSLTLTSAGGHKVSTMQNLLATFFSHTFQLIRMIFNGMLKQFKLNNPIILLSKT